MDETDSDPEISFDQKNERYRHSNSASSTSSTGLSFRSASGDSPGADKTYTLAKREQQSSDGDTTDRNSNTRTKPSRTRLTRSKPNRADRKLQAPKRDDERRAADRSTKTRRSERLSEKVADKQNRSKVDDTRHLTKHVDETRRLSEFAAKNVETQDRVGDTDHDLRYDLRRFGGHSYDDNVTQLRGEDFVNEARNKGDFYTDTQTHNQRYKREVSKDDQGPNEGHCNERPRDFDLAQSRDICCKREMQPGDRHLREFRFVGDNARQLRGYSAAVDDVPIGNRTTKHEFPYQLRGYGRGFGHGVPNDVRQFDVPSENHGSARAPFGDTDHEPRHVSRNACGNLTCFDDTCRHDDNLEYDRRADTQQIDAPSRGNNKARAQSRSVDGEIRNDTRYFRGDLTSTNNTQSCNESDDDARAPRENPAGARGPAAGHRDPSSQTRPMADAGPTIITHRLKIENM